MADPSLKKRAIGCIRAVAVGDAMRRLTEGFWPEEILSTYGGWITHYKEPLHPRGPQKGKRQERWGYAEVTDDTRFTLLVAKSIIERRCVDREDIIRKILNDESKIKGWPGWEGFSRAAAKGEEEIAEFAKWRDSNGAPMRVSPVGIINKPSRLGKIIKDVDVACSMTHGAKSTLSGACAMAAAISTAIEGYERRELFQSAVKAARLGEFLGSDDNRRPADRILTGVDFVNSYRGSQLASDLRRVLNPGFSAYEGVPYALTLAYGIPSAKDAILAAANQGGDTDSIAEMAGSVAAALSPETLPKEWIREVEQANKLNMGKTALGLLSLRQ